MPTEGGRKVRKVSYLIMVVGTIGNLEYFDDRFRATEEIIFCTRCLVRLSETNNPLGA